MLIGGEQPGARNVIAFSTSFGISIIGIKGATVSRNLLYRNNPGIAHGFSGGTPNDPKDTDTGSNNLQNHPIIASASTVNDFTQVSANLNSTPNRTFRIEYFSAPSCTDGKAEARKYIGAQDATTNNNGIASSSLFGISPITAGSYVTTTATDKTTGDTSELSPCVQITGQQLTQTIAPTEDTYVKGSTAEVNYGTVGLLQIKRTLNPGSGKGRQSYLRFDTTGITGTITSAKLRVFGRMNAPGANNLNTFIPCAVFPVSAAWDEVTLTWVNKPSPNVPAELSRVIVTDDVERWYEFDITDYLNNERAQGRAITGVLLRNMLKSEAGDFYTVFRSKEAATNQPQLVITP